MSVSVRPSVSDQPDPHFDRSMVNPSGPVTVLPPPDLPHLLSLIFLTISSRWLFQSASHWSIDVGAGGAVVVDPPVEPPRAALTPDSTPELSVVRRLPPPPSSP